MIVKLGLRSILIKRKLTMLFDATRYFQQTFSEMNLTHQNDRKG